MSSIKTSEKSIYVALLRGINVGGKHCLPMQELARIFTQLKCVNVRTYIQSGNVVFSTPPKLVKDLPGIVSKTIEQRFGFSAPVVLRTREQLAQTVRGNPFLKAGLPEQTLHVYFLADQPSAAGVKSLGPDRSAPDRFHVAGREIYLHVPNGSTKLTSAYFDSRLSTVCTARNWATVIQLLELMQSSAS